MLINVKHENSAFLPGLSGWHGSHLAMKADSAFR